MENKKLFIVQGVDGLIVGTQLHLSQESQSFFILDENEISGNIPTSILVIDSSKIVRFDSNAQQPQEVPVPNVEEPEIPFPAEQKLSPEVEY